MKRDNDFLRDLLFEIEASEASSVDSYPDDGASHSKRHYHLVLLADAELASHVGQGFFRLTTQGHDFLEAIRDEGVWSRTKEAIRETGGNATVEVLKALATGFLKKKIFEQTGVEL